MGGRRAGRAGVQGTWEGQGVLEGQETREEKGFRGQGVQEERNRRERRMRPGTGWKGRSAESVGNPSTQEDGEPGNCGAGKGERSPEWLTGKTGARERKDSRRQEDERAGSPSRQGSLEDPVQRARDAARLGVRAGKGNAGGKEGPGMPGMWPCRVGKGRRGKGRSEGWRIRSHEGDATYRERGRAGVRQGKGVQGVCKGQEIQLRMECETAGVLKEQERRRV